MAYSLYNWRYHSFLLTVVIIVTIWSVLNPHDLFTWFLEAFPVLIFIPVLLVTYKKFQFTDVAYTFIAIHMIILLVGGHYTYAEVPLFNWIRDEFSYSRNNYDKVGHLAQGFVPALVGRELILRTSSLQPGKWLFAIIVLGCLGISAIYEIVEWLVAEMTGELAESFLGTQGDVWDTQKDMLFAGIGAIVSLLILSPLHNKQLLSKFPSDNKYSKRNSEQLSIEIAVGNILPVRNDHKGQGR